MINLAHLPKKVKSMLSFSFPVIEKFYPRKGFVGGRYGYAKDYVFQWLLVKKITHWDYRTVGEMSGISHPTLVRRNGQFQERKVYQKFFLFLVRHALKLDLIKGEKVALDSSFIKTYSHKEEPGSGGFNGHKKDYGFKLHVLIDTRTKFPLAVILTDGLTHDSQLAIPLMKKAKPFLRKAGYVLADKGYDNLDIVNWIVRNLKAKAGIPLRKKSTLAKGKPHRYGNLTNWKLKARGRTFKKSLLNFRTEVERFFSTLKRGYHLGKELTRGLRAFTINAYQSLISYCLNIFYLEGVTNF